MRAHRVLYITSVGPPSLSHSLALSVSLTDCLSQTLAHHVGLVFFLHNPLFFFAAGIASPCNKAKSSACSVKL